MQTGEIGTTAGKVWRALHNEGELSLSALKKAVGGQTVLVDWAIGWLAREDKIIFRKDKNALKVALKK